MLNVGDSVERYVIEAVLGEGGMGRVYRALDPRLGRRVALKVLLAEGVSAEVKRDAAQRMMREARAAAAFNHPNVVAIHDVGEVDGAPYITMELVNGATLRGSVGDANVPLEQRVTWLKDVARGLGAAHRAGLVHRDIKPENVMVTTDGVVKILDFGIARRSEDASPVDAGGDTAAAPLASLTTEGMMIGTPQYMPPEQLQAKPLDGRADQFAWGVMAWELLAGRLPWGGVTNGAQLVAAVLSTPVRPLAEVDPSVPVDVSGVVARALSKERDQRFATMEDLLVALEGRRTPAAAPSVASDPSPKGQDLAFEATAIQPATPAPARTPEPTARLASTTSATSVESVAAGERLRTARPFRPVRTAVVVLLVAVATGLPATVWRWMKEGGETHTAKTATSSHVTSEKTEGPVLGACPDGTTNDCSSASSPWCDQAGHFVACCAPGLVAVGSDGACDCPPGGTAPGDARVDCPKARKNGGIPEAEEQLAILKPKLRACYDQALATNQSLSGKTVLKAQIAPDGRVFRVRVKEGQMASQAMQSCLLDEMRRARFAPPAGGSGSLELPIVFAQADAQPERAHD